MKAKDKPITPKQALANFRLLLELSPRNSYTAYREAVQEITRAVLERGIAVRKPKCRKRYAAYIWGWHLQGHPADARHELAVKVGKHYVPITDFPMSSTFQQDDDPPVEITAEQMVAHVRAIERKLNS